jgi:hypothetical protein
MNRNSPALFPDDHELDELILKILSRSPFGLPANRIHKELPPSHRRSTKHISARLQDLRDSGRVQAWEPPPGKSKTPPGIIYSLESLGPVVGNVTLELLKDRTITPAEIKKNFPAYINKYLLGFLEPLLNKGMIKWHPPRKGKRLSLREPNPVDFLSAEIRKLFEKGEKLGFEPEAILQAVQTYPKPSSSKQPPALTAAEAERTILKAMTSLKPAAAQGALVYIPDLRQALRSTFPGKEPFDRAILELARLEKVQLQSHSLPAELTEEQRAAMIDNGRGSYFMAVGIRME